jgi:soluble lytic murein transglycosylase-like protein
MHRFSLLKRWTLAATLGSMPGLLLADCIDSAAAYHHVHPYVLRAIAYQESGMRPATVGQNRNGTIDIGLMGINSVHLRELGGYGIPPGRLGEACTNAYVGAWFLRRKIDKYGNTWQAVAAYHSETPEIGAGYAQRIQRILAGWGVLRLERNRRQAPSSVSAIQALQSDQASSSSASASTTTSSI